MIELRGVCVVDVATGRVGEPVVIRTEGGAIAAIEPSPTPLNAARGFVLPGLIDTHVHLFFDGGDDPRGSLLHASEAERHAVARGNADRALAAGITTVRDLGAPTDLVLALAAEVETGPHPGPTIIASGAPLTRRGGHLHDFGGEVRSAGEARAAVERLGARGAGAIKVVVSGGGLTPDTRPEALELPPETLRAAVDAAHAQGLAVAAHCHATGAIAAAIEARVDSVEHASFLDPDGTVRVDPELVARLRDAGIAVAPTAAAALRTAARYRAVGRAANSADRSAVERLEARRWLAGLLLRSGVTIVAGSDAGVTDTPPDALLDELDAYRDVGFTPAEALRSATTDAARVLGLPKTGRIAVGWAADMVVLAADPLTDPGALRRPLAVIHRGRQVAGGSLVMSMGRTPSARSR